MGVQSRATGSIMWGRNYQADYISRNTERSVLSVKVKSINSQVTMNGYDIYDPESGTIAINELDINSDTCFLGANFTILIMASITANIYPYNPL